MNILVINGPNLNFLGKRNIEIYGDETLDELMEWLENSSDGKLHSFKFYQSNHEGVIIDIIQDESMWADGIIINPGALGHYSYSIRDALDSISVPCIEVHISNINEREEFRAKSVIEDVCIERIHGQGKLSYLNALKKLATL
jgi:3-dehydroquinate dehydratase-2